MTSASSPTRPSEPTPKPRAITGASFTGSPLGKLAPTGLSRWVVLLEALLLPTCAVLLGLWLNPQDPLWVHADFHWVWLAPMIVALRYGPLTGLLSAGVVLAGWWWFQQQYVHFPQVFFLGGLILVLLVGEFSSLWVARTRRAEGMQHYLHQRTEHLIRQYYLLRLSHDRLEHELIGRPMSMRDALKTLRGLDSMESGAASLLDLLAQYCQIGAAAVYAVQNDTLAEQPLASIGATLTLHPQDPLLRQALETRKLCHVVQTLALKATKPVFDGGPTAGFGR
jgi:polysaccharide biosynthesis protein PelD